MNPLDWFDSLVDMVEEFTGAPFIVCVVIALAVAFVGFIILDIIAHIILA